jgi:hypothetical protein
MPLFPGPQSGYKTLTTLQHGRYLFPANQGSLYRGGSQAVVATALSAGVPTAYTGGLVLYNPVASTANLSILEASFAAIVAQTNASMIGLGVAASATALAGTLTAVAIQNSIVGAAVTGAQAKLYSSASITLPVAPAIMRPLTAVGSGAETVALNDGVATFDIGGGIILPPGSYCVFTSTAAGTASSTLFGFAWEEVPIS